MVCGRAQMTAGDRRLLPVMRACTPAACSVLPRASLTPLPTLSNRLCSPEVSSHFLTTVPTLLYGIGRSLASRSASSSSRPTRKINVSSHLKPDDNHPYADHYTRHPVSDEDDFKISSRPSADESNEHGDDRRDQHADEKRPRLSNQPVQLQAQGEQRAGESGRAKTHGSRIYIFHLRSVEPQPKSRFSERAYSPALNGWLAGYRPWSVGMTRDNSTTHLMASRPGAKFLAEESARSNTSRLYVQRGFQEFRICRTDRDRSWPAVAEMFRHESCAMFPFVSDHAPVRREATRCTAIGRRRGGCRFVHRTTHRRGRSRVRPGLTIENPAG